MNISPSLRIAFLVLFNLIFSNTSPADDIPLKEGRLIMGYYSHSITEMASRSDIELSLNYWAKDLLAEEGRKVNIHFTEAKAILYDHMEDLHEAMLHGEIDMVVAPPILIARYFKRSELTDGFTAMLAGKKPESMVLISRNENNIKSVKDLSGKKFLMLEDDEMADMYLDLLFMKQFNKSYKKLVASVDKQKKASRIILDIYFNKADAGIVYRSAYDVMTELNPDIANKIIILDQYPIKSRNFSFFSHDYPFVNDMTDGALMAFQEHPRGKQILEVFRTPELDFCKLAELDVFDDFYAEYRKLKQKAEK